MDDYGPPFSSCGLYLSAASNRERLLYTTLRCLVFKTPSHFSAFSLRSVEKSPPERHFAHCSLFHFLDFKFYSVACPSELHPLVWFFLKVPSEKREKYPKTHPKRLSSLRLHSFVYTASGYPSAKCVHTDFFISLWKLRYG